MEAYKQTDRQTDCLALPYMHRMSQSSFSGVPCDTGFAVSQNTHQNTVNVLAFRSVKTAV